VPDTGGPCLLLCASVSRVFRSGKDNESAADVRREAGGRRGIVLTPRILLDRRSLLFPSFLFVRRVRLRDSEKRRGEERRGEERRGGGGGTLDLSQLRINTVVRRRGEGRGGEARSYFHSLA